MRCKRFMRMLPESYDEEWGHLSKIHCEKPDGHEKDVLPGEVSVCEFSHSFYGREYYLSEILELDDGG